MPGGAGDDLLIGGAGNDRLVGCIGADAFHFDAPAWGYEERYDFVVGADKIDWPARPPALAS